MAASIFDVLGQIEALTVQISAATGEIGQLTAATEANTLLLSKISQQLASLQSLAAAGINGLQVQVGSVQSSGTTLTQQFNHGLQILEAILAGMATANGQNSQTQLLGEIWQGVSDILSGTFGGPSQIVGDPASVDIVSQQLPPP